MGFRPAGRALALVCAALLTQETRAQEAPGSAAEAGQPRAAPSDAGQSRAAPTGETGQPPPGDAEDVVAQVLAANPSLEALAAQVTALEHAAAQTAAWADPVLSLEYSNMPFTEPYPGGSPMSGVQVTARQTLPAPGVIGARREVAEGRVQVGTLDLEETRNRLAGLARTLWHELALVRQLTRITEQHLAEVGRLVRAVRAAYEVGRAQQHELIRLSVLRAQIGEDLSDLRQQEVVVLAELNAAMARPPEAEVKTPPRTAFPPAPETLEPLMELARERRPLLAQLDQEARVERLAADLSRTQKRLEPTVWAGYRYRRPVPGRDPGDDFFTVGVSVPLPWFWNDVRWEEAALEHLARARAAEARLAAALDELRADLAGALARWRRAAERARAYRRVLIPQTRTALQSAFAAYQVGRADFATVYETEVDLLDLERMLRRAQSEAARAAVEVARLTGVAPLPLEVPGPEDEGARDDNDDDGAGGADGADGEEKSAERGAGDTTEAAGREEGGT